MSNFDKSALTDHTVTHNHIIDWERAKLIDKEPNRTTRKERKPFGSERQKPPMNRDKGNYELPHVCDDVIHLK